MEVDCPECGGCGYHVVMVPECCGHALPTGECCGNAIPGQAQEQCSFCGGNGTVPDPGPPCEECGKWDCHCWDCPTCKGKGTVNPLTAPDDFFCVGVADCPHCDGTGEML